MAEPPYYDAGVAFPSTGELISIRVDVNAPEFGPMRSAPPTLISSISAPSVSIYGSSSPSTKVEGESKEFGPHVCLVLTMEVIGITPGESKCVLRIYDSIAEYPEWHISLPYDGDLNNCPSPARFGRPLGVGSYLGVK